MLGCLATLLVLFYPLPSIEVNSSALARAVAGLQEWKEFLIALIAGCAIALGVVFMSRKKEALYFIPIFNRNNRRFIEK